MRKHFSLALWFAFSGAVACVIPGLADTRVNTNPPPGIGPTTATLQQVFAAHEKAVGDLKKFSSDLEEGEISEYGLKGTYRFVRSQEDFRDIVSLGVLSYQWGKVNGQRWRQDENGQVILLHDVHMEDAVSSAALNKTNPTEADGVRLVGEVASPVAAYVIEVNPKGGRHEWRFYDKKTYFLDRIEAIYPDDRWIRTYTDYKTVSGITEAWHVHEGDNHPQNDVEWTTRAHTMGAQVAAGELQMPENNNALVIFPPAKHSVTIPIRIVDGKIVVRATVKERGLDFYLDSGSSGIVFDTGVSRQLGLQPLGKEIRTTAGVYEASNALIPEMHVGELTMRNVVVESLPFTADADSATEIVGLIGFDFIANVVLSIDYQRATLTASQPGYFVPPADAYVLPALLDDGVPYVTAQIGEAVGTHFILDTGASSGMLYSAFAQAHPKDVKDQGAGSIMNGYYTFMYAGGVGGEFRIKAMQLKNLSLGGVNFQDWIMYQPINSPAFENEDNDGLIGYDFLKYFTLYLDYRDSQIYLQPNDLARRNASYR